MELRRTCLAFSISRAILGGAFALGSLIDPACAADTPPDTAAPSTSDAKSTSDDASIGVITVTAQSRSQQAQAVPIAMQLVTSDQINKLAATNIGELNGYIPGLVVDADQPTQPNYTLRGLGATDFGIGTDGPVGIYVDGVYTGKTGGALMNFNDIQRIEVLKGPQGTLFGRNSAAGAISIVTKEPSSEFEADAHVRVGQYGERYMDSLLNVPLNDNMALRFTFVDDKASGWLTDAATGQRLNSTGDWGTRTTLLWNAPEHTKVLLTWEHESLDQNAIPAIGIVAVPTLPVNPATFLNPLSVPVYNDVAGDMETRVYDGVTLRIEHPMSWATFNSTTAYRHFTSGNLEGNNGTNQITTYLDTNNIESNGTWQQEFKLSGKNSMVDWLTGASLFSETAHQTSQVDTTTDTLNTLFNNVAGVPLYSQLQGAIQQFGLPINLFGNTWQESMINKGSYKSYALYGDAIWHLTDRMNFTTGVRFTYDSKDFSWFNPPRAAPGLDADLAALNQVGFFPGLVQAGALTQQQAAQAQAQLAQNIEFNNPAATYARVAMSNSWTNVSPRFVLDYKLTPDMLVYGSVTEGYQSGGFNAEAVGGAYQPEKIWSYEAGLKSYFREQHLLVNASLFAYKFSNLQALNLVANGSAIPTYQVTSSDQTATGLDFEARWQPTHDFRMVLSSEYIDQIYKNYITPDGINLNEQPVGTPFWSAAVGFDYTQHGVAGGSINYSLSDAYTGATRCNSDPLQGTCLSAPTFTVGEAKQHTDGRIGWDRDDRKLGVALYVKNIFNNRYVNSIGNTSANTLGTPYATVSPPRMIGLEVHAAM
jgi:iron complex outermembrane receptor protein